MPITVKFQVNPPRGDLFKQQPGGGSPILQISMRPRLLSDERLDFGMSPWRAAYPLGWTLFCAIAVIAGWRSPAVAVGIVCVVAGLIATAGFVWWQETLSLDLVARTYRHSRGYWPRVATDEGALGEITGVTLDQQVRSGKNGPVVLWIVALRFADPAKSIVVANFVVEGEAYRRFDDLAKRLGVPAVDRTGAGERVTGPAEIETPLAARAESRRTMPALPEGSRIQVLGEPPASRILLPSGGFLRLGAIVPALLPLIGLWAMGMLSDPRFSWPFIGAALLFAIIGIISLLTHREIGETPESLVISTRLGPLPLSRQHFDKRAITDIAVKPVPGREAYAQELQIRTAAAVANLRERRLSAADFAWLAQALTATLRAT